MSICININGVITPAGEAKIPVLDHGLLFGDSVYETVRTYDHKPFLFSRHFQRLEHSAEGIQLRLPWSKDETRMQIVETLKAAAHLRESRIRLMVTRGVGELSPDVETCGDPLVIIIAAELTELPERFYKEGVNVVISGVKRANPYADLKTGSLIHQVLAFREARSKRAFEAILLTADGCLSDGITSNIYLVRQGRLMTPSHEAGIVEGITRGAVLDLARESGVPVEEGFFKVSEIDQAEEMFLTSTTRQVLPITRVDGKPVAGGHPGPVTQRLMEAYSGAVLKLIEED
jgi:branched-chain amino acid aminotransferase